MISQCTGLTERTIKLNIDMPNTVIIGKEKKKKLLVSVFLFLFWV